MPWEEYISAYADKFTSISRDPNTSNNPRLPWHASSEVLQGSTRRGTLPSRAAYSIVIQEYCQNPTPLCSARPTATLTQSLFIPRGPKPPSLLSTTTSSAVQRPLPLNRKRAVVSGIFLVFQKQPLSQSAAFESRMSISNSRKH